MKKANPSQASKLENIIHLDEQLKAIAPYLELSQKSKKIKLAVQAIKARNKVVHELHLPSEADKPKIKIDALLEVVASLNFGTQFKLPSAQIDNMEATAEQWEQTE